MSTKARFSSRLALETGEALWGEHLAKLTQIDARDLREAWRLFRTHIDKRWSFTDCTSNAVMRRLHIKKVFSFDHHFSQMPGLQRVP